MTVVKVSRQRMAVGVVLALAAAAVLFWGLAGVYSLAEEYGDFEDSLAHRVRDVVLGGLLLALPTWGLLHAALRVSRLRIRSVVAFAGVLALTSVSIAVTGTLGVPMHEAGERRAAAACTPDRVTVFVQLGLPYTVSAPAGQSDGSCMDTFMVPGTKAQVDARIDARLMALGWTRVPNSPSTSSQSRQYRRGTLRLTMWDEQQGLEQVGYVMVPMVLDTIDATASESPATGGAPALETGGNMPPPTRVTPTSVTTGDQPPNHGTLHTPNQRS
jgi:hypothetical protein